MTLSISEDEARQRWELHGPEGEVRRVDLQPRVAGFDFPLLQSMVKDGFGITMLPETVCADAVRNGELEVVLPDWSLPQGVCHAVFASRRACRRCACSSTSWPSTCRRSWRPSRLDCGGACEKAKADQGQCTGCAGGGCRLRRRVGSAGPCPALLYSGADQFRPNSRSQKLRRRGAAGGGPAATTGASSTAISSALRGFFRNRAWSIAGHLAHVQAFGHCRQCAALQQHPQCLRTVQADRLVQGGAATARFDQVGALRHPPTGFAMPPRRLVLLQPPAAPASASAAGRLSR